MFKVKRVVWNGVDQPTAGLYHIIRPGPGKPYWQLLYHNPTRTIYLSGNVKIVSQEITSKQPKGDKHE